MSAARRIAIGIEYDGSAYAGWQAQASAPSVQSKVEIALSAVADSPISVTCAGRTDAGVHAVGQVAHFDAEVERSTRSWTLGANTHLPNDICVLWAREVRSAFHARYSAQARTYRYVILNRPSRPALSRHRACWIHRPLDERRMAEAAAHLLGEHDFSAFRAAECQSRTPVRRVEALDVHRNGEYVFLDVRANAFLHHMVRNIAGVLIEVGTGDAEAGWVRAVLEGKDRTRGGVTAPPGGLYLLAVQYPAEFELPETGVAGSNDLSFMMPRLADGPGPGPAR
jgi:tRNA pseudouridine38-40 synthase